MASNERRVQPSPSHRRSKLVVENPFPSLSNNWQVHELQRAMRYQHIEPSKYQHIAPTTQCLVPAACEAVWGTTAQIFAHLAGRDVPFRRLLSAGQVVDCGRRSFNGRRMGQVSMGWRCRPDVADSRAAFQTYAGAPLGQARVVLRQHEGPR